MAIPTVILSWSTRRLARNRRFFVLLIVLLLLLLYLVLNRHPPPDAYQGQPPLPTHILSTTPSNESFPFHLISLANPSTSYALPLTGELGEDTRTFFPTHIVQNPTDSSLFYVTNEVPAGEVLTVRLARLGSDQFALEIVASTASGGREPAFAIVTDDGRYLLVSNYNSPTVSLYAIPPSPSFLPIPHLLQTLHLPAPAGSTAAAAASHHHHHHPHQLIQHPYISSLFYIPDLGNGVVWLVERQHRTLRVLEDFLVEVNEKIGKGPRHGVISKDGTTLFLALQQTSSLLVLALDPRTGRILPLPPSPFTRSFSTLPPHLLASTPLSSFALSDVTLDPFERYVYIANRRVVGPYDGADDSPEYDSIAVFPLSPSPSPSHSSNQHLSVNIKNLKSRFKILPPKPMTISGPPFYLSTGCWQPRELLPLSDGRLVVSCVRPGEGPGGGLVLLNVDERTSDSDRRHGGTARQRKYVVSEAEAEVNRWGGSGSWGIVPVYL